MSMLINPYVFGAGSGGDNPPVTSGLILNWEADTIGLSDGANIGTGDWLDSSAAANHPVNVAGAGNPFYRDTGGPGGLPSVEFDAVGGSATDSRFDLTADITDGDFTMFAVIKPGDSDVRTILGAPSGGTTGAQYRINALKQEFLKAGTTLYGTSTTSLSTSVFSSINVTWNNTTQAFAFRLNGSNDGSGTGGGSPLAGVIRYMAWNEANVVTREPYLGFVSALLVYNVILSGGDITTVEGWLTTRWGV